MYYDVNNSYIWHTVVLVYISLPNWHTRGIGMCYIAIYIPLLRTEISASQKHFTSIPLYSSRSGALNSNPAGMAADRYLIHVEVMFCYLGGSIGNLSGGLR